MNAIIGIPHDFCQTTKDKDHAEAQNVEEKLFLRLYVMLNLFLDLNNMDSYIDAHIISG